MDSYPMATNGWLHNSLEWYSRSFTSQNNYCAKLEAMWVTIACTDLYTRLHIRSDAMSGIDTITSAAHRLVIAHIHDREDTLESIVDQPGDVIIADIVH